MSFWKLALLIALFNVMTFGNGPVMIPLLQTHLVEGSRVLTQDQLLYAFTIARITPGQANFLCREHRLHALRDARRNRRDTRHHSAGLHHDPAAAWL